MLTISGTGEMDDYVWNSGSEKTNSPWWDYREAIEKIIICDGVTKIGDHVFYGCMSLKAITIPDSVTKIGKGAFSNCESLQEIKIPNGVTFIGEVAFGGCDSLTAITIPDGVTYIGDYVFGWCSNLKKIFYPLGRGFEENLRAENRAKLIPYTPPLKPKSVPPAQIQPPKPVKVSTPAPVVEKLRWKVEGKTLTVGGVRVIKDYSREHPPWLANLRDIQEIVIEEGVEKISANAFIECTHLELLTIPASVKTIGDCAFTFCYCGVNNGKNVLWSLADGVLIIKKNPAAKTDADFSTGTISWRAVEGNITGVKLERGITPNKKLFDWLSKLSPDISVSL